MIVQTEGEPKKRVSVPVDPRVSEALPGFLEYLKVELSRTPATLEQYQAHMVRFIKAVGDRPVQKIDGECVSLYKRRLMDSGLGPATISSMLGCLRSFLKYLRDDQEMSVYDAEKVRRPKIPTREIAFLGKDEVRRFLGAISTKSFTGIRDRALAEALCSTGMRISEVLALDRKAVDWEVGEARIIGKGNRQRKVYFSASAIDWLQKYLERRWDADPALFITNGNDPRRLDGRGARKQIKRYGLLAGINRNVYPHMLRHTMATALLENGCPIGHIRVLLGHAHLATTCKYYLGRMSDRDAKAAHGRYLTYDGSPETGDRTCGTDNVRPGELTEEAA
jgi:site-specific recombinase XerD